MKDLISMWNKTRLIVLVAVTAAVELIPREEDPEAANVWLKGAYG